jgi:ribosomal protein S1
MAFTSFFPCHALSNTCSKFSNCSRRKKTLGWVEPFLWRWNKQLVINKQRRAFGSNNVSILFSLAVLEDSPGSSSVSTSNDVHNGKENKLSLEQLQLNKEYEAVVTKVTEYGAFVDIGAVKYGLLHVSHMSDSFVRDPSEMVKVGDKIKVRVLRVDLEKGLFSVTMRSSTERKPKTGAIRSSNSKSKQAVKEENKRRLEGPALSKALLQFAENVDPAKFFKANVINITDFGVFVDVGGPKDGLIFRPDLTQEVQAGEEIMVRIKKIDVARNFITCTMKPLEEFEKSLPLVRGNVE